MVEEIVKSQAFKLKGRLYTLTVVHIINTDKDLFQEQVLKAVKSAPRLFEGTPVIIDCSFIADESFDLAWTVACLKKHGMSPIAVQTALPSYIALAMQENLPVLSASASQDKSLQIQENTETKPVTSQFRHHSMPVRSGQQIASPNGDLIVTAAVSHGAELLADGNIHIYGPLRGRALAGIKGNKQARIFCQSLDAELVAIAGIYCLSEVIHRVDYPCQIFLDDDRIQIEAL